MLCYLNALYFSHCKPETFQESKYIFAMLFFKDSYGELEELEPRMNL